MRMSEKERKELHKKIYAALMISTEKTLREKAARGEKVCYSKPDGTVYTITARTALRRFLAQKQS